VISMACEKKTRSGGGRKRLLEWSRQGDTTIKEGSRAVSVDREGSVWGKKSPPLTQMLIARIAGYGGAPIEISKKRCNIYSVGLDIEK